MGIVEEMVEIWLNEVYDTTFFVALPHVPPSLSLPTKDILYICALSLHT